VVEVRPRVTGLMPVWNAEAFLERTLAALSSQTYADFHVVISDDASSDATPDICRGVMARDSRFTLIRQPANLGWVQNMNFLLRQPAGDYVFFAFHDDVLMPACLERLVQRLDENPGAAVAFSDVEVVEYSGTIRRASYSGLDGLEHPLARAQALIAREDNWWLPIHGLFRTSHTKQIGGFSTHLAGEFSADWPWLIDLVLLGEAERVPDLLCRKVQREGSVANRWSFEPRHWYAVALSCARRVLASGITPREKSILLADLVRFCGARQREARAWRQGQIKAAGENNRSG